PQRSPLNERVVLSVKVQQTSIPEPDERRRLASCKEEHVISRPQPVKPESRRVDARDGHAMASRRIRSEAPPPGSGQADEVVPEPVEARDILAHVAHPARSCIHAVEAERGAGDAGRPGGISEDGHRSPIGGPTWKEG